MIELKKLKTLRENIETVIFGKTESVCQVLIALLARGHVLLEDVPGVGKTVLTRAIAKSIDCAFSRIQMTPDLLPSDILGVSVYESATGQFNFKRGPVFANIVLADEINRTTPRTQSALLEAMNEFQVTADGKTYQLDQPFMVMATQNPYEFEGTYFLPENQLDRFMLKVRMGYPDRASEREILLKQPSTHMLTKLPAVMTAADLVTLQNHVEKVRVDATIVEYILSISEATRRSQELSVGLSPRGSQALLQASRAKAMIDGRDFVTPDDVKTLAISVCAHRVVAKAFAQDGASSAAEGVFAKILQTIPVPQ